MLNQLTHFTSQLALQHQEQHREDGSFIHSHLLSLSEERTSAKVNRNLNEHFLLQAYKSRNDLDVLSALVKYKLKGNLRERHQQFAMDIDSYFKEKIGVALTSEYFS